VNAAAVALVTTFAVCAVADWVVIWRGTGRLRVLTKPAATAALVAVAALAGDMAGDARAALVVAAVLCLAGDVALLGDSEKRFLLGLSAFAAGHVAYIVTALIVGVSWPRLAWAFPVLASLLWFQARTRMLAGASRRGGTAMLVAVGAYSAIISVMVVTAFGTASWLAAAGATLFAASDSMIGADRFGQRQPADNRRADLPIMVTYHLGQLLLIGGLIVAG
jgi:uncharacterized membrane protein YhhN